jgi:HlyD family secretion protein
MSDNPDRPWGVFGMVRSTAGKDQVTELKQESTPERSFQGSKTRWLWLLLLPLALTLAAVGMISSARRQQTTSAGENRAMAPKAVSALGLVEPKGGVAVLSAPYYSNGPSIVQELRVHEGDWVRAGQVLAVLDSKPLVEGMVRQTQARVAAARSRVAQIKAAPKSADVAALEQQRASLQASLQNARTEDERYRELRESGLVSAEAAEGKRLAVTTIEHAIGEINNRIRSLSEVRQSDIDVAEADLAAVRADEELVRRELAATVVRAPFAGRVLAVRARPGEEVGTRGLLELAQTSEMHVVAEVYEGDIGRVRVGQLAEISGEALARPVVGRVEAMGSSVASSEVLPSDPSAFADQRVIKVDVRTDDGRPLEKLIRARVAVVFRP